MDSIDFASLSTAPAKRLAELADYYGLEQTGQKKVWWVRKTATNRLTGKVEALKLSLRTVDLRDALRKAIPQVETFLTKSKSMSAPVVSVVTGKLVIGKLEAAYLAAPTVRANVATRKLNWAQLERIFSAVHPEVNFSTASVEMLDRELAKAWQRARLAEIEAAHPDDVLAQEEGKRGMNSKLGHAQSIFSRQALEDFHELGLPECVRGFAEALSVKARKQEEPVQLGEIQVGALMAALPALGKDKPAVWVAFQLMLWGGLRNVDCVHARRSWLVAEGDGYRLTMKPGDDYLPKGKSGSVFLSAAVADAILGMSQPTEFEPAEVTAQRHLVPSKSPTARSNAIYRELNEWLRSVGVGEESNKVAYRLRKFFLAAVAEQQGRAMASLAARHSDATTLDFYVAKPKMNQPITLAMQAVG
jgi:hypothetical protein